jgi:hypothetical protein
VGAVCVCLYVWRMCVCHICYYHICVLILLQMCPHALSALTICVLMHVILLTPFNYNTCMCVCIVLHLCPHASTYASAYTYTRNKFASRSSTLTSLCVCILLHLCPHTFKYVSSHNYSRDSHNAVQLRHVFPAGAGCVPSLTRAGCSG